MFQARERVGEILKEHYLSYPQLDLILPMFSRFTQSAVAEPLFRAARQSPDHRVRASATYQLADFLWELSASSLEIADLRADASRRKDEEHFERLTAMQAGSPRSVSRPRRRPRGGKSRLSYRMNFNNTRSQFGNDAGSNFPIFPAA